MNDKKTGCIVVGTGLLTRHMAPFLREKPWYETAALVDVRPEALAKAKEAFSTDDSALFTDLEDAVRRTGAGVAIINTPSEVHYALTKQALEAGLHVL